MKQKQTLVLAAALLLACTAAGCGNSPAPAESVATETVYSLDGLEAAIPAKYEAQLVVNIGGEAKQSWGEPLLKVYEKASQEASLADYGNSEGIGFLFGIIRLDQAAYEQHLSSDYGGIQPFARDSAGNYYAKTTPTDVQFYRSGDGIDVESADWKNWETLNALGDPFCADFVTRNGLTAYDDSTFYDRDFTYDGDHAYVNNYTYASFDGDRRLWDTLVLSQPAKQGEGGIWCVERFYDVYGTVYYTFPGGGVPAETHYATLQSQCDSGAHAELRTPLGAALDFVRTGDWHNDENVTEESLALTAEPDFAYFTLNAAMSDYLRGHTGAGLQFSGADDPTISLFLERLSAFTTNTWGVLGRMNYGSDWWAPLQGALEEIAVGADQEARTAAFMHLYLTVPGEPYATDIAALLRKQQAADSGVFDAAIAAYSLPEQTTIQAAVD